MLEAPWVTEIYFVVPGPGGRLLARGGGLPLLSLEKRFWQADVRNFAPELREYLGEAAVLRCLEFRRDPDNRRNRIVYEAEPLSELAGEWVAAESIQTSPEVAGVLRRYLSAPDSELRVPWARPGWFAQARDWTRGELEKLGYAVGAVGQFKAWSLSSVLCAETDRERVFFKAAIGPRAVSSPEPHLLSPLFGHEPMLTQALSARFPDLVPAPLAVDAQRRWMLLADFGAALGEQKPDLDTWRLLLGRYAAAQRAVAGDLGWLTAAGCLDRRPQTLKLQFAALLADDRAMGVLNGEEAGQLRVLAPQLLAACDELEGLGVPFSLMHGDLHSGNVALRDGRFSIFDWTDACAAHPFLDLPYLLDDLREELGAEAQETLLAAYLEPWADLLPAPDPAALMPLMERVANLHQAVSYWKIAEGLEPSAKFEMGSATSLYLRRLLPPSAPPGPND